MADVISDVLMWRLCPSQLVKMKTCSGGCTNYVPGVVPIMFWGMSGGFTTATETVTTKAAYWGGVPYGVLKYPTCKFWIFSAPHPSLYTPMAFYMNFQVPSYPLAIRPGYSLFSLKIQRILRICWSDAVYLILFCIKCFKCIFNDRICFPYVQTIRLIKVWPWIRLTSRTFEN
jgi:hypothetical protein